MIDVVRLWGEYFRLVEYPWSRWAPDWCCRRCRRGYGLDHRKCYPTREWHL